MYDQKTISEIVGLSRKFVKVDALEAFHLMVIQFHALFGRNATTGPHGAFNNFRLIRDGSNFFAFTANEKWVKCWFRNPGFSAGFFSREDVLAAFPLATINTRNELTMKISNYAEAAAVISFIQSHLAVAK